MFTTKDFLDYWNVAVCNIDVDKILFGETNNNYQGSKIIQEDNKYVLYVDVAGLSKDDINIKTKENFIDIEITYPENHPFYPKEKKTYQYSIKKIDKDAIIANYKENGLLVIEMPLAKEAKEKIIKIT